MGERVQGRRGADDCWRGFLQGGDGISTCAHFAQVLGLVSFAEGNALIGSSGVDLSTANKVMNLVKLPTGTTIQCFREAETSLILEEIFLREVYPVTAELRPEGRSPLVIDVGANVGVFVHYVLSKWPDAVVHAVEPAPPTVELLRRNVELLDPKVMVHECCIGGQSGTASMTFYPGYSIMSRLAGAEESDESLLRSCVTQEMEKRLPPGRGVSERHLRVAMGDRLEGAMRFDCRVVDMNEFVATAGISAIDFLKLDAEGSETAILHALTPDTWGKINAIAMEVHEYAGQPRALPGLVDLLNTQGFVTRIGEEAGSGESKTVMLYGVRDDRGKT